MNDDEAGITFAKPIARDMKMDLAIIGTVGLPARYGGFETLAHELSTRFASNRSVLVYCTRHGRSDFPTQFGQIELDYVNWNANGWQSILYDFVCLWRARRRARTILVLGVSGGLIIPLLRRISPGTRFITNVDGVEWKREKWGRLARWILKISESAAVRSSHTIVADNQGIVEHVRSHYGCESVLIAYGGDNQRETAALQADARDTQFAAGDYCFTVCRIEPENHLHLILQAFAATPGQCLVIVGNWEVSEYARQLYKRYSEYKNIELLKPIYDQDRLHRLRREARAYIHGHSAGGTNPSLVEAMFSAVPILAFDVSYNRHTTEQRAAYWASADQLRELIKAPEKSQLDENGAAMLAIAQRRYTWAEIARSYESVLFPALRKK